MRYFTIPELCDSAIARGNGIDNSAPPEAAENLTTLVAEVPDPLREAWGKPIYVNSGYRCPRVNRLAGGVATSMHLSGNAADITTGNSLDNRRLYQLAQDLRLPFFELIGNKYGFAWLHISHCPGRKRRTPS